jgi:glycine cleavage system T protein
MSIKSTALLSVHEKLGARIVDFAGYYMPLQYTSILDEHQAVRTTVGVFDVSHMGEFMVSGPGVKAFLDSVTVNNVAKLKHGQIHYSAMMTPEGGIVDDLLVYCRDDEHFMLVVNASNRDKDFAWLKSHCPAGVTLEDHSDDWSLLAVQGPKAWPLICRLSDEPGLRPCRTTGSAMATCAAFPSSSAAPATPASGVSNCMCATSTPWRCGPCSSRRVPPTASAPSAWAPVTRCASR